MSTSHERDDLDAVEDSSPVVRYSAKELFAKIDRKLDVLLDLIQGKADKVEVDKLAETIVEHGSRIQSLEDHTTNLREVAKALAWAVGTMLASAGVIIAYYALH